MPRRQQMKGGLSFGQIKKGVKSAVKAGKPVATSIGKAALSSALAEAKKQGNKALGNGGRRGGRRGRAAPKRGAGPIGKVFGTVGGLADVIGLGRRRGGGMYLPGTYK